MIIKATRVRARGSALKKLIAHIDNAEDNEEVVTLRGNFADLWDARDDARAFGREYCVRQWVVSPSTDVTFEKMLGRLMPGQFARISMGQPKPEQALLVSERAVGTDQNKKFVMVIDANNKAEYREVMLGASVDGMRVVTNGLSAGERIVVNGLQRVKPGVTVKPEVVAMTAASVTTATTVAQR